MQDHVRCIIAGSRDGIGYDAVEKAVEASGWADRITTVLSGGARGVDTYGERWAEASGPPVERHPPKWSQHGGAAGPIRNREMAECSDALVAVWDGESKGTRNMIEQARARRLQVYVHQVEQRVEDRAEGP